jgi:hypothetical protein
MSYASFLNQGGAVGPDVKTLTGDLGGSVGPNALGDINIQGGTNINTAGFPGANQLQINLDDSVVLLGNLTAGTGVIVTTGGVQVLDGDVSLSSGRVILPDTSAGYVDGTINFGGDVYLHNYGTDNFFVGPDTGNTTLTVATATDNFTIGSNSMQNLTTGSHNVALGNNVLNAIDTGGYNVAMAPSALASLTSGNYNTAYGREAGAFLVNGISNLIIGYQSGISYTTNESSNLIIGNAGVVGEDNTIRIGTVGAGAGQQLKTYIANCYSNYGTLNIFLGENTGNVTLTGTKNVMLGSDYTGRDITTGSENVIVGDSSFQDATTASENTGVGHAVMDVLVTGTANTCVGRSSLGQLLAGSYNTAAGFWCLRELTGGNYNTALGYRAGNAYNTGVESSNIVIRNSGVAAESNTIRIGTTGAGDGQQNRAFLAGTYGITPATVAATGSMIIDSAGQIGSLAPATNGQLVIGSTGATPVLGTITAGTNVQVTNAAGSITIDAIGTASFGWVEASVNTTIVINTGYIANKAGLLTLTLPATAVQGSIIEFTNINTAVGLRIAQNANQYIRIGTSTSTPGIGGYVETTQIGDSLKLVCIVGGASTGWQACPGPQGNWTIS